MKWRLRRWWHALGAFDRVGTALLTWELATLAMSVVLLPLACQGRGPFSMYLLLAANLIGLGTAVAAWLLTLVMVPTRGQEVRQETLRDFIEREVKAFRARHAGQVGQRI
jgi:predicted membrane metal-binding protein